MLNSWYLALVLPINAHQIDGTLYISNNLSEIPVSQQTVENTEVKMIVEPLTGRFAKIIAETAKKERVPVALVHAIIKAESNYNPNALSPKGAQGLMQLMPATAKRYGVTDRTNPTKNIQAGVRYLKDLLVMFNGNVKLAIAGYNAGENAVIRYNYQIPPYKETRNYVRIVINYYNFLSQSKY